jgi:hypothetical protein
MWRAMLRRRDVLRFGAGAFLASTSHSAMLAGAGPHNEKRQPRAVPHQFPPFELQAARPALLALQNHVAGYAIERMGKGASLVWVRSHSGQLWVIGVDQRDLQFKFEVFTLGIETIEATQARIAAWKPPQLPADMPDLLRKLVSTRPEPPRPPAEFQPWPFDSWRVEVLRRAEYIVEDVDPGPTFGDNSNAQSAGKPGQVPPGTSASCDVAVALLFTAAAGRRLLIAADWFPFSMVVTQADREIDDYLAPCERLPAEEYAARLPLSV